MQSNIPVNLDEYRSLIITQINNSISQGKRNKSKNKQMGPNQTYKLLHRKGNHEQNKKNNLQNGIQYLQTM